MKQYLYFSAHKFTFWDQLEGDDVIFHSGAKGGWNFAWKTMMTELAPQDAEGSYNRPRYDFAADPISSLTVVSILDPKKWHYRLNNKCEKFNNLAGMIELF